MGLEEIGFYDDDDDGDDARICRTQSRDVLWVFVVAVMD